MRILWQLQLSNYFDGKFSLVGDSNWTTFLSKIKELKKHDPELQITVVLPLIEYIHEDADVELKAHGVYSYVRIYNMYVPVNAILSRYHFNTMSWSDALLATYPHVVYINDPCLVGNVKALLVQYKLKSLLISQCHFLDSPNNPLVPRDVSYVYRTAEACEKADMVVWHCESQRKEFDREYDAFNIDSSNHVVWKSGHHKAWLDKPINMGNIRFDTTKVPHTAAVVWVPNRIGGLGKSFDYTNNGRFLFEELPKVRTEDFMVLCGNPSQKITNNEIAERVPNYVKLVDGVLNEDEYKWCAQRADIVVALYDKDTNGGIAVLESMYYGAFPLMPDINEYANYFMESYFPYGPRVSADLSDIAQSLDALFAWLREPVANKLRNHIQHMLDKYSVETSTKYFYEKLHERLTSV